MPASLRLSGITVPLESVVLAVLVALFVGLYLGVRAGRWSAGCDDGPNGGGDFDGRAGT